MNKPITYLLKLVNNYTPIHTHDQTINCAA